MVQVPKEALAALVQSVTTNLTVAGGVVQIAPQVTVGLTRHIFGVKYHNKSANAAFIEIGEGDAQNTLDRVKDSSQLQALLGDRDNEINDIESPLFTITSGDFFTGQTTGALSDIQVTVFFYDL